jgi:hypothetical protein
MFTELKKGRWTYMLIAAIASIALAALTSLFTTHAITQAQTGAGNNQEPFVTSSHVQTNYNTVRFIN